MSKYRFQREREAENHKAGAVAFTDTDTFQRAIDSYSETLVSSCQSCEMGVMCMLKVCTNCAACGPSLHKIFAMASLPCLDSYC